MTWRRYLRLLLVVAGPLLLGGFFAAPYLAQRQQNSLLTCEAMSPIFESCRDLGWEGRLLDEVTRSHPAWFSAGLVEDDLDDQISIIAQASQRKLDDATIVSAIPHNPHGPEVANLLASFVGKPAQIVLGIANGEKSIVQRESIILFCNSLKFGKYSQEYESSCYGNNWSGILKYSLGKEGSEKINSLKGEILEKYKEEKRSALLYKIVFYPLFLYIFIVVSALLWLGGKAYRFVKAG